MLNFKRQREELIERLELAKTLADDQREKAEEAIRAKSKFLATMSHELRTPLNAIMGYSEILSGELMGPHTVGPTRATPHDIRHSGQYLLSLINDILDLSRIEAGRQELKEEVVSLVGHRARMRPLRGGLRGRKEAHLHPRPRPEPADALADKRQVGQIWINLLSNAIKFTPEGGEVTLTTRHLPHGGLFMASRTQAPAYRRAKSTRCAAPSCGARMRPARDRRRRPRTVDRQRTGAAARRRAADPEHPRQGTTVTVTFPAKRTLENQRADIAPTCRRRATASASSSPSPPRRRAAPLCR